VNEPAGFPDSAGFNLSKGKHKEMDMIQSKQQGFTLLELLVVITLLAVLSVGALVAYEGVGDNAQATAAANNTVTADGAIRNYRAVTGKYPDQWDNLSAPATGNTFDGLTEAQAVAAETAGTPLVVARATRDTFGDFNIGASTLSAAFAVPFEEVGIGAVQQVAGQTAGVAPNLLHNEGANGTVNALESDIDALTHVAVVPNYGSTGACQAGGQTIATAYNGTVLTADNGFLNKINDHLEGGICHLVVALGFGHDAAHSTLNSSVAMSAAPTYSSNKINPANSYGRYIGLFWLGSDANANDNVEAGEINPTARLIAVVTPEGKTLDESLAAATAAN